jgi:signal transduction histidine kinase
MPGGGRIVVYTYSTDILPKSLSAPLELKAGTYLVIGVDDNGAGMAPEVAMSAFDPFFTTKERGQGTGLGLAMVYGFARQSGGTARIQSAPGLGTSVQLYLPSEPLIDEHAPPATPLPKTGKPRRSRKSPT